MSEFQDNQLYQNLLSLLKVFKNRPNHLAKYLVENNAFNQDFIKKIIESDKLNKFKDNLDTSLNTIYFVDITHMNDFLNSIMDKSSKKKPISSLSPDELNSRLDSSLKEERYEDAIRIRDYMIKHNIKRNSDKK